MAKAKAPTSQKNPAWVVTVGAMKGGAGKTMVVDNIAGCLAERYKVLVVDADPQANASKGLGIDIADPDMTTLADVLTNQGTPPEDAVIRAPLRDLPNLDVMPSSILLFKTEFELAAKGERIRLLGYYLQDNSEFFGRYDYIIIDTNTCGARNCAPSSAAPTSPRDLWSATTTSASSWHPRCSTTSARAKTWAVCSLIPSSRTA